MPLTSGTRLGSYQIIAAIGLGGMCEVYRARDRRLNRDVALKVLPPELHEDNAERERFAREARAVAALNHPGIVTIHSIEEANGVQFLTMELVEGRTLADLIPESGWPLDKLLRIAIPLTDAVGAAHQRGIAHRDLKPANIMVTPDGRVKVLDFGLAKLLKPSSTLTSTTRSGATPRSNQTLTADGQILGTVAYMSPEQAEGKPSDQRSDIFSLGVLLYEIASGERPFQGETTLALLSSVLEDTPRPLSEIKPELPRDLWQTVRRCLMKDPARRYESAADLRDELAKLEDLVKLRGLEGSATYRMSESRWPGTIALVSVAAALGFVLAFWLRPGSESASTVLQWSHTRLTVTDDPERFPAISPDGKWVTYVSAGAGNDDVYLRPLQSIAGQTAVNLTRESSADDTMPAFSPDGESIAFRSERDGGGLFVMRRTGEGARRLTMSGYYPSWLPDGRDIVFSTQGPDGPDGQRSFSELWIVSANGGQPRPITTGDAVQPQVSPHAHRIAYWGGPASKTSKQLTSATSDIWTVDLSGAHPVRVTEDAADDWNPIWSSDGRWLFFLSNRAGTMNLWRIAVDERTGVARGDAQAISSQPTYMAHLSLSADGRVGAYSSVESTRDLAHVGFDASAGTVVGHARAITSSLHDVRSFDVTSDGRSIVAATGSLENHEDLYVISVDGGSIRRLTDDFAHDRFPAWTRDSGRILFYSDRRGTFDWWSIEPDASHLSQLARSRTEMPLLTRAGESIAAGEMVGAGGAWTADRRHRIFAQQGRLVIADASSQGNHELLAITGESLEFPVLSADNSQLFFVRSVSRRDIWTVRFGETSPAQK